MKGALAPLMLRSADDLPWVPVAGGAHLRVPHADPAAGLFVLNSRLAPGYRSGRHLHSGDVFVVTLSGAWKYLEHPEVNGAGSYLYEPEGSAHTLEVLASNGEVTEFWAVVHGALIYLDDDNQEVDQLDAAGARALYEQGCVAAGLGRPDII